MSVTVNPPKTPVTAGSHGFAAATLPNVCKMPGPPAPFVPTPLPNIGRSDDSPKGYSKQVTITGKAVAIKGASFKSVGDIASKSTGGGIVSSNTHGLTKFAGPGSMDVKIEGKNVQLLSDPMLNNCGGSGSSANSATLLGLIQNCGLVVVVQEGPCPICGKEHDSFAETDDSKADATSLFKQFKTEVTPARKQGLSIQTMLGVVLCKCGKKYADQSGITTIELCDAAKAAGMKHPPGVTASYMTGRFSDQMKGKAETAVISRMRAHLKDSKVFRKRLELAELKAARSGANKKQAASYPPGACAAQKTLLLLLDDKAVPAAMTETIFGGETGAPIAYLKREGKQVGSKWRGGRAWKTELVVETFKQGSTVPPCGTCELLVPLLICDDERPTCKHRT